MSAASPAQPVDDGRGLLAGLAAAAVPLVWLTVLMMIGIAELLVDPDHERDLGSFLNAVSVLWLAIGAIAVPVASTLLARWFGAATRQSILIGLLALVVLALGAWLEALIWTNVLYEVAT